MHFDRLSGQFLNFPKSTGLSNAKEGMEMLKDLSVEGSPLLIAQDATSLEALVSTAMQPNNFIQRKRTDNDLLLVRRLQHLPIESAKHETHFIAAKVAPQACFGVSRI